MPQLFLGNALCAVAPSGRIVLPLFARGGFTTNTQIMIGVHETDNCLVGYRRDHAETLAADCQRRIAAEPAQSMAHHSRARRIFGFVQECACSGRGELKLPPMMRRRTRIDDVALVVGTGETFEIWNPHLALDSGDPDLADLAGFHLEFAQAS